MNCPMEARETAGWLLDYASGRLDAETRARFGEHLDACPACRAVAGGQQAVWKALEAWEPAPVSMDFDRSLYQRIERQASWWSRLTRPFDALFRHAVPIGAAAGVVILAGLLMNRPAVQPAAPVQESAQVETLQPDQVEHAVDDMEMLREFNHLVPDSAESKM
jgi:anti-sigma factor RsiW